MIKLIVLVTLLFVETQANDCFDRCQIVDWTGAKSNAILSEGSWDRGWSDEMDLLPLTNYHCIMKCANKLTKATMSVVMDTTHDKFNAQCIMIENLDFCVQYWKQRNDVDCEEPIRNMVKQAFQAESGTSDCYNEYINASYSSKFENSTVLKN